MGLVTLLKNYLRWTQAVVLGPLIVGARRPWLKIAWSMLLVTTTAAFVVQSYFLVTDHLSYKTSTEIRLVYEPEAPFPAVTFCNLNPFKKSMVEHSQELTNLVATYIYVIKMKQEELASRTTAAARTTTTGTETHERKKRQAGWTNGIAPSSPSTSPKLESSFMTTTTPKTTALATTLEPTTTKQPSPYTKPETTTTPSASTPETTTAPQASTTAPSITTAGVSATATVAESTTSEATPSPCQKTQYPGNAASTPRNYSVWNCPDGTAFIEFGGCNVTNRLTTTSFPLSDIHRWKDDMASIFYRCFHNFCTTGNCAYTDGVNAIEVEKDCLGRVDGDLALDWVAVQVLSSYCNYPDAACSLGMVSSYAPDGCNPRECGRVKTTVCQSGCSNQPGVDSNYTDSYTYECVWPNNKLECTQDITCSPAAASKPTTIKSPSSSTTPTIKTTPSARTLKTTAPPRSSSQLSITTAGVAASTSVAETTTTDLTTTNMQPTTTKSLPLTSTTANSTRTTADKTRTTDTTRSTTTTSETTLATAASESDSTNEATRTSSLAYKLSTAEKSTILQATNSVEPTRTERISTTKENTMTMYSPSTPSTATRASKTTRSTASKSPIASSATSEAQMTSASTLRASTTASATVPSTNSTAKALKTISTEPAVSETPVISTELAQESSSVKTTGSTSTLSTTFGLSMTSSSATDPVEDNRFSTSESSLGPSIFSTTVITSRKSSRQYSTLINNFLTAPYGVPITEVTHAARQPTVVSVSVHATGRPIATASVEAVVSFTASQSVASTAQQITTTEPAIQPPESSTKTSSNSGINEATSGTPTNWLEPAMSSVGETIDSARTTEKAVISSPQASTLARSSSSTATQTPSNAITNAGTEEATTSSSVGPSHRSSTPSSLIPTPVGGTGRPDTSTDPVHKGRSASTTENRIQSSKSLERSRPTPASSVTKPTTYDFTAATPILASSSPLYAQDTWSTTAADVTGSERSTTLTAVPTFTTITEQAPGYTTAKGLASTSSRRAAGGERHRTSTSSADSNTLKDSYTTTNSSSTQSKIDGPYSTVGPIEGSDMATTTGTDADNSATTTSSTLQTEPVLAGGHVIAMPTVDNRQSTTRTTNDPEQHATTGTNGNADDDDGSSHSTTTTRALDSSVDPSTKQSTAMEGESNPHQTTRSPDPSGSELTTTTYEDYLKSIKLNVGFDFALSDLTEDQKQNFKDLSDAYGLDPSSTLPVVDANMKLALQTVAAKMSLEQRQILGFQLKDLVSSCIMNGDPCDTASDFKQTYDVDYGNCYTFNYGMPVKYITKRAGGSYGLRMTIMSNSTEVFPSSEQGVKIVVHSQDIAPFPNVEGYRSSVGEAAQLQLTRAKFSKLGAPYGNCSTLDSLAKNKQPFYYNGSYSTEGCFRSCFQRNIATACGCADARFPSPTDTNVPFCDQLEPTKYKCMQKYIQDNGDYHSVDNCQCYDPCEDTAYRSQIFESPWPAGDFFYGGYCPLAKRLNVDCSEYYSENAMNLEVSYAQLGYKSVEEEPLSTVWILFNALAGNSGFWVGYTMLSFMELVLVSIQMFLWCCGCPRLPEVPNPDDDDFSDDDDDSDGSDSDDDDDDQPGPSGAPSMSRIGPPKNFDNSIFDKVSTKREIQAITQWQQGLYRRKQSFEPVVPVIAV